MGVNIHLKKRAISLRKSGKSYNDIRKILKIKSKGTLSSWFKNMPLSKKALGLLEKNTRIAYERGLFTANKNRRIIIDKENKKSYLEGQDSIYRLSKKEILIIGATLYWAEGKKSERSALSLTFSNSDPYMVNVYMRFIREILKIPEERIRAGIHIYPSLVSSQCKNFWSEITKLPENRFYIVTQVSRASQNKRPFNILPYGTIAIKVNSRIQFYKVKGMIQGIISKASILN